MPQIDATTWRSPNHAPRSKKISAIVVHHGTGTRTSDLRWLTNPASRVSAHYYVCRDGTIYQLVPDDRVAWHAGDALIGLERDVNGISLGIEMEHTNDPKIPVAQHHTDWPSAQLDALSWLLRLKLATYNLRTSAIYSHRAVAVPSGRKTDPGPERPLAPESAFRTWVDALSLPPEKRKKLPLHGAVLTNVASLDRLEQHVIAGAHTLCKVVTTDRWGAPPGGWTLESRARVIGMTGATIVRTVTGDPSAGMPFLHVEQLAAQIDPWYAIRRHNLYIELGNEPNSDATIDPSGYAYHMVASIAECRARYPLATIIAGGLLLDPNSLSAQRWVNNNEYRAALLLCDMIGIHAYAFHNFDDTTQLALAERLYADIPKPRALTEYGINDVQTSDAVKMQRYAQFICSLPPAYTIATFYHIADITDNANDAAYAIELSAELAYKNGLTLE